jgi:hypothetical protein
VLLGEKFMAEEADQALLGLPHQRPLRREPAQLPRHPVHARQVVHIRLSTYQVLESLSVGDSKQGLGIKCGRELRT